MTKAEKQREQAYALEYLRSLVKPGQELHTILKHVSRSGMSRSIAVIGVDEGKPVDVSWAVARVTEMPFDRDRGGVKVGGRGMDMGFHLAYSLSRTLWPDGFGCVGDRCPSNDHSNGDRDYTPHGHRGPQYDGTKESLKHWHNDGGYALIHRWL